MATYPVCHQYGGVGDARRDVDHPRMLTTLGSWSGLVANQRGLTPPSRSVSATTAFLLRNAAWLTAHAAAGEVSEEIAKLVRDGRRVVRPDRGRTVQVGPCAERDCAGTLRLARSDHSEGAGPEIRCDVEPAHRWARHRWKELNRSLEVAGVANGSAPAVERWLTASDVALLQQVPVGTVYRLASEQGWRRQRRAGRTYYSERDIDSCFGSRPVRR